jgi:hypothetical protein
VSGEESMTRVARAVFREGSAGCLGGFSGFVAINGIGGSSRRLGLRGCHTHCGHNGKSDALRSLHRRLDLYADIILLEDSLRVSIQLIDLTGRG